MSPRRLPQPSPEATRQRLAGLIDASPDAAWEESLPPDPSEEAIATAGGRGLPWRRESVLVVCSILLVGLLVGGFTLLRSRPVAVPSTTVPLAAPSSGGFAAARSSSPTPSLTATPSPRGSIAAHVIGEVKHPGLVALASGARVDDAITAAGGLTSRANTGDLNLAQPLLDGQQVRIGSTAEPGGEVRGPAATPAVSTAPGPHGSTPAAATIRLNSATSAELEELPGIGPASAKKIIAWRDQHGGFRTVDQLQDVPGIGPKTYADIAPRVTL
ncbi:helix-hairpin-helix domain-containing protein [Raineyella fluvialis]|uniref:Helix-hairpin-helix DNA-binding motif class 1 domain-containing protein n=1 Tax=Raineyella fluvialis TaxID=2662261 RepID=A0A5Q2FFM5_9ACTN|nr:helix-hairpin-helix domain-containing protein [Raineyella fluvialis]QGF24314.1 hypothetical protein Rai3103_12310 [Raineyella fluvialis]